MRPRLIQWLWLWSCCVCVLAAGCGEGTEEPEFEAALRGKVTRGGQALQVDKAQHGDYANVKLILIPLEGGTSHNVTVEEDGSFEVYLPEGQTITPGKYRVAVYQWNPEPEKDELEGKFSEETSPIEREITGSGQELVIDLDNP